MTDLAALNHWRKVAGLGPLRADPQLRRKAQQYAAVLAQMGRLMHAPNTVELLAVGRLSAGQAAREWIESPVHRAILTDPTYTHAGIGSATARGQTYWVARLVRKERT